MKNLNVKDVENMANESHLITAAKTVFEAMAYESCVREVVEPKQQKVVDFYKFAVCPEMLKYNAGTQITKATQMYLASDDDFQIYLKEMNLFYIAEGFKLPAFGYCPLLMAEDLTRQAKMYFVDALEPYTGLSYKNLICSEHALENLHNKS